MHVQRVRETIRANCNIYFKTVDLIRITYSKKLILSEGTKIYINILALYYNAGE